MKRNRTAYNKNKDLDNIKEALEEQGLDPTLVEQRLRNRSRSKSLAAIKNKKKGEMLDEDAEDGDRARSKIREASRSRSKGFKREMSK